jgi:hypothetical protein
MPGSLTRIRTVRSDSRLANCEKRLGRFSPFHSSEDDETEKLDGRLVSFILVFLCGLMVSKERAMPSGANASPTIAWKSLTNESRLHSPHELMQLWMS